MFELCNLYVSCQFTVACIRCNGCAHDAYSIAVLILLNIPGSVFYVIFLVLTCKSVFFSCYLPQNVLLDRVLYIFFYLSLLLLLVIKFSLS